MLHKEIDYKYLKSTVIVGVAIKKLLKVGIVTDGQFKSTKSYRGDLR